MDRRLIYAFPSVPGKDKWITCYLCNTSLKVAPVASTDRQRLYFALEHIAKHSNCDLHVRDRGGGLVLNYPFSEHRRVGFRYVTEYIPQLCMIKFDDVDEFIKTIGHSLRCYLPDWSRNFDEWPERNGGMLNSSFVGITGRLDIDDIIRKNIREFKYKCGICGMHYDCGLPTIEIASSHLA